MNQLQILDSEKSVPYCLVMKNGIDIWMDESSAKNLMQKMDGTQHKIITFDDFQFNTAEYVGLFPQQVMEDLGKKKDGWYRCSKLKWHNKNNPCDCGMPTIPKL